MQKMPDKINKARKVVDTIKEAFAVFDAMELPMEERECTLSYDAAMTLVDGFEQLEAAQPKWIGVDEKHPDDGEWVLTYCGGYAKWFDLNKWCGKCWLKTMPVTHWMQLQEQPKEE